MNKRNMLRAATGAASLAGTALFAYTAAIRPWHMRWGATDEEVRRAMPGDEIVPHPTYNATRAITINARPKAIWPWLVQLGQGRGGMYSYEWIENRLMRLDMHNADRILPEFQHLHVGDVVPMSPAGIGPRVRALRPNQFLLLVFDDSAWTWSFGLYPAAHRQTRLVIRNRWDITGSLPMLLMSVVLDPGDFMMERRMLLGIKQRAEGVRNHAVAI
ncbi:MAG TPA: hypothetical protein VFT66_09210 [Roseiflexaceae bacterium]|nr:hypothetical protein [Roseiflexaceae bacterium]